MDSLNHWILRRLVPDAALPPTSLQAGLRWNDERGGARSPQNRRAFFSFSRLIRPLRLTRWVYLSVVIPAQAGIQETKPGGRMTTGFYRNRIAWPSCGGHFRQAGMACLNHWIPACAGMTAEVDSSLCQAATGIHALSPHTGLPAHKWRQEWIPALSEAGAPSPLRVNTTPKIDAMRLSPVVIPAQAGIQETKPGGRMTTGFYRNRIAWPSCGGHARQAGMACLNHWIPACAGMTAGVDSEFWRNDARAVGMARNPSRLPGQYNPGAPVRVIAPGGSPYCATSTDSYPRASALNSGAWGNLACLPSSSRRS